MASRNSLSLLALAVVLGGLAFYALGLSNKVEEQPAENKRQIAEQEAMNNTAGEVAGNAEHNHADHAMAMDNSAQNATENSLNTLAPAAGEEAAAEKKEAVEAAPAKTPKTAEEVLSGDALQLVYGKPDAPVKMVEYFSLSCPHCAQFYKESQPKLIEKYIDTGKVYYQKRFFPHNAPGLGATALMQCVTEDKKTEFMAALFNMQDKWAFSNDFKKNLLSIAQIGGMGPTDFEVCLGDKKIEERILTQRQDAMDGLKLEGIPSIIINGKKLDGFSYGRVAEAIDAELKAAGE